jgi:hypothetical protein
MSDAGQGVILGQYGDSGPIAASPGRSSEGRIHTGYALFYNKALLLKFFREPCAGLMFLHTDLGVHVDATTERNKALCAFVHPMYQSVL